MQAIYLSDKDRLWRGIQSDWVQVIRTRTKSISVNFSELFFRVSRGRRLIREPQCPRRVQLGFQLAYARRQHLVPFPHGQVGVLGRRSRSRTVRTPCGQRSLFVRSPCGRRTYLQVFRGDHLFLRSAQLILQVLSPDGTYATRV